MSCLSGIPGIFRPRPFLRVLLCTALALGLVFCPALAGQKPAPAPQSAQPSGDSTQAAPKLSVAVGKSLILKSKNNISRVSIAQPEISDFVLLSPNQLYLTGKTPGITTLTLWDAGDKVRHIYDIEVSPDVSRLKQMVHAIMPEESGVEIITAHDFITLSGTIKSNGNLRKLAALAEAYAPGKVLNLLQSGGVQQIMLEVRIAEMGQSVMKRLGFNFNYVYNNNFVYSFFNALTSLDQQGNLQLTSNVQGSFRINSKYPSSTTNNAAWTGFVDVLKQNGLVRVLAEPTLVCLDGQSASFLAGGEVPIPVPQGNGAIGIQYKDFGVKLKFTPTLVAPDKISMVVEPEVSDTDYTNAITVNNQRIPAITTRRASTTVELKDGQSFAIAGLLNQKSSDTNTRLPVAGDIPILGALFKSREFQKSETELVIIITPHLAKPLDKDQMTLPTEDYTDPDDVEFYLGITPAMRDYFKGDQKNPKKGGLDGDFGAMQPQMPQAASQ